MKEFRASKNTGLLSANFCGQDVFDIICNALCPKIPSFSDFPQALTGECLEYSSVIQQMHYIIHNDVESPRNYVVIVYIYVVIVEDLA